MKKFLLSSTVLTVFILYAIALRSRSEDEASRKVYANLPISTPGGQAVVPGASGVSAPVATPASSLPSPVTKGKYKDGSFTGNVADAYYGNVQVQAIISGGKIIDVKFLQYPNDRSTSIEINSQAMPLLTQEAIQAQSARIDGVSGASATTQAFIESLGNALHQAAI